MGMTQDNLGRTLAQSNEKCKSASVTGWVKLGLLSVDHEELDGGSCLLLFVSDREMSSMASSLISLAACMYVCQKGTVPYCI